MKLAHAIRGPRIFVVLSMLLPATAFSLDLYNNTGTPGDWFHVVDAPAISDRVYWDDLGPGFTYEAQCATDTAFTTGTGGSVVVDETALTTNYLSEDLEAGEYYYQVREVADEDPDNPGDWSMGTLAVYEDVEWPVVEILSPLGGSFSSGDALAIEIEVSDDTVPHVAQFRINGDYVGSIGLMTENYKIRPSLGEPRTFVFETETPRGNGPLEISVIVSDVTYKQVTTSVVVDSSNTGGTSKGGKGGGKGGKKK
jgi:hypothetical protein